MVFIWSHPLYPIHSCFSMGLSIQWIRQANKSESQKALNEVLHHLSHLLSNSFLFFLVRFFSDLLDVKVVWRVGDAV